MLFYCRQKKSSFVLNLYFFTLLVQNPNCHESGLFQAVLFVLAKYLARNYFRIIIISAKYFICHHKNIG